MGSIVVQWSALPQQRQKIAGQINGHFLCGISSYSDIEIPSVFAMVHSTSVFIPRELKTLFGMIENSWFQVAVFHVVLQLLRQLQISTFVFTRSQFVCQLQFSHNLEHRRSDDRKWMMDRWIIVAPRKYTLMCLLSLTDTTPPAMLSVPTCTPANLNGALFSVLYCVIICALQYF